MASRQLTVETRGDYMKASRVHKKKTGGPRGGRSRADAFHVTKTTKNRKAAAAAKKREKKNFTNKIRSVQAMSRRPVSEKELIEIYR